MNVKVLFAWRAVVYSFLNLNYLEQKQKVSKKCLQWCIF